MRTVATLAVMAGLLVTAGGIQVTSANLGWSPSPNVDTDFEAAPRSLSPTNTDTYTLTSGYNMALRGGTVRSLTACVYGW